MPLVAFSPALLNVFAIKVNSLDRASFINMGASANDNITNYLKINNGFGVQIGDLSPALSCGTVIDPDVLDSPVGPAPSFQNTF